MSTGQRIKRRIAKAFWRVANPFARAAAGIAPWWVVLETTGARSGQCRRAPLARGPVDGRTAWLIAVHGDRSAFARNIAADPRVRLRLLGRWHTGTASLTPLDEHVLRRFSRYARTGPRVIGIDPKLVRIELDQTP